MGASRSSAPTFIFCRPSRWRLAGSSGQCRNVPDKATRHIVTGAEYVEQITAGESDRRARAAFLDLVLSIAQPGATLFDFGAGTGMDARFYAESGFRVRAYDVDREMCGFFSAHCRDLMEAGRVTLESGAYRDFL